MLFTSKFEKKNEICIPTIKNINGPKQKIVILHST